MTEKEVIELMSSSKNEAEWNENCDKVKKACNGYPSFWYGAIVLSGLMDRTLGDGASQIKITTF